MNIAVVLYGQPRDYVKGYNNIMNFLKKQNTTFDFFFHCWKLNDGDCYKHSPWRLINKEELCFRENMLLDLQELYKPLSYEVENQNEVTFDESLYKDTIAFNNTTREIHLQNINNTLYHLYSRNKARKLLQNYLDKNNDIKYDFVLFVRFDIDIMPEANLSEMDKTKTYISDTHCPRKIIADCCIITPTTIFLEWFNYENLKDIYDNADLLQNIRELNETIYINPEESLFAKYIFHYKNTENIGYFKGGTMIWR